MLLKYRNQRDNIVAHLRPTFSQVGASRESYQPLFEYEGSSLAEGFVSIYPTMQLFML